MQEEKIIEGYLGITPERKLSKAPARLDFWQSATGLFLALFMIAHMFFVSSILLGKEAMYAITKFFELDFIFEGGKPIIVSIIAAIVIVAFVTHAFLAVRKFPINYKQFLSFKVHKDLMKHGDTSYWGLQVLTGFALFFLGSIHLYIMLTKPDTIGPSTSAYRFVHDHFWLLYLVLLIAVEIHGSVGLYRLCIKWGWFEGLGIKTLRTIKMGMTIFFLALGICTYAAYVSIGLGQDSQKTLQDYKAQDIQDFGKKESK